MHSRYIELVHQWMSTVQGRNYWTCAPKLCENFRPGELTFYYRDYSPKTHWMGAVNNRGIPVMEELDGRTFYHPMALAQKALGHWNLWQQSHRLQLQHLDAFLSLALWLCDSQEAGGGWAIDCLRNPIYLLPYSAMAQGQVVSVLARASTIAKEPGFIKAARSGITFMLIPIERGGTSRSMPEGLILEEYLMQNCDGVLNGWINAVFGLYDYLVVDSDVSASLSLESSIKALAACLPQYDLGFWSNYDLCGTVASPYYHEVHIAQLRALEVAFPAFGQQFRSFREQLEVYSSSRICKTRAVATKVVQKALSPPRTVLKLPAGAT